jgi:glucose-6-phosphate isomerase
MIDLKESSGLPIFFDKSALKLIFQEGIPPIEPDVRTLEQARPVLLNPEIEKPSELYYMYRGIAYSQHQALLKKHNLRYDITLLPATPLGEEFNKTVGHYHPPASSSSCTYPETYEVIWGKAIYLLQKALLKEEGQEVVNVVAITAQAGDRVIIPPGYGHITINPSLTEPLLMANATADGFKSIYEPLAQTRGGAYYLTVQGKWVENLNYTHRSSLKEVSANTLAIEESGLPLYTNLVQEPLSFHFLVHPEKHLDFWSQIEKQLRA